MVLNNPAPGMNTGEIVTEDTIIHEENWTRDESSDNGGSEKRGRGRPAGSLNKSSNGPSQMKAEVATLNAKVESLQAQIRRMEQSPPVQLNVPAASNQLEKRVTVIQEWVETFHQFLLTSRITNSVDRVAEDELALIIQKMPDN